MNLYSIALYVHFLSLLAAIAASALAFQGALRVRVETNAREALSTLGRTKKIAKVFPISTLGLLASGGYMTHAQWTWTTPWVLASLAGLAMISALGGGIEGRRGRALAMELAGNGFSDRARRLQRDPVAWTAKMGTLTLVLAVVLIMTTKPDAAGAIAMLGGALVLAVVAAVPFWSAVGDAARAPVADGQGG